MQPWSVFSGRRKALSQIFFVTRCRCKQHGTLAHNVKTVTPQHPPSTIEIPVVPCRPDPYALLSPELSQLRSNLLGLLGSAHPALNNVAQHYFLHPSKQLRPLVVLLFARATNGLGRRWAEKKWTAECERVSGRQEELDQPLTRTGVLNNWNANMPDDTPSFESLFPLQTPKVQPELPPLPESYVRSHDGNLTLADPPTILPSQFRLAQLVEMIHIASSFHDEVVDRLSVGKNSPSTKDTMGNKLAILGGDFLLGRASCTLSRLGDDEVVELVASVISNIVEGTIWHMKSVPSSRPIVSPESPTQAWKEYFNRIYLKHASLLAKGARGAAILGGSGEGEILKEIAYAYGRHLGFANQLTKDTVDYEATEGQFDQLVEESPYPTGPLLHAWEDYPELGPLILRNFSNSGDVEQVQHLVRASSGVERTRALARTHANKARELLYLLPHSETRDALEELTERVIDQAW
ncbi:terpenoid synthase [Dendrothele bispora CBS 962.96]|uniref:Terpenoid synthase n=1 Tax=Dendrothele bispora (strain CBS 962.96) TaxID=1314807 RepID=A0A4S8MUB3_DENBC|nr:terpenoid synthase [Dendrothele bispora CBS 962.96]